MGLHRKRETFIDANMAAIQTPNEAVAEQDLERGDARGPLEMNERPNSRVVLCSQDQPYRRTLGGACPYSRVTHVSWVYDCSTCYFGVGG